MPSNAMKASQLVARLQTLIAEHGDLDCVLALTAEAKAVAVDGRNVSAQVRFPWGALPAPVFVFGMWIGETGAATTLPGQLYQVTASSDEWNYDRHQAPADKTPLKVWKRYGGQDDGYRDGERWYVFEGGERAIEIVPDGVLGWNL